VLIKKFWLWMGNPFFGVMVVVTGEADLLEVVGAIDPGSRRAHFLDGGQEQADEDGDDSDHH
jgi:hypothetical protein